MYIPKVSECLLRLTSGRHVPFVLTFIGLLWQANNGGICSLTISVPVGKILQKLLSSGGPTLLGEEHINLGKGAHLLGFLSIPYDSTL